MPGTAHSMRRAIVMAAGTLALAALAPAAQAQRSTPRQGRGVEPPPPPPESYPASLAATDPRWHDRRGQHLRRPAGPGPQSPVVVYVVVPADGYYQPAVYGGVTDANGRPLSAGFDQAPTPDAIPSFTPDLSGSPFVVIETGAMMVDFPNGERRTFPSCAAEDPDGRPRTVFYYGEGRGLVLRAGQRGRVQGQPAAGVKACYTIDAYGRIALEY